jgi:GST-like protein
MIDLHYFPTPNGWKVSIALEELGLPYRIVSCNIARGEQFTPEFLALSPNNRMPAIVDHDPVGGGAPLSVFESGAILHYLAEKTGRLLPSDPRRRVQALEWMYWQMANQGPMCGQAGHFRNYAPEPLPYAIDRYTREARRLYEVLDRRLAGRAFIADELSMADILCWPWIQMRDHHGQTLEDLPDLRRWFEALSARPAFVRGLAAGAELLSDMPARLDPEAKRHLFGHEEAD